MGKNTGENSRNSNSITFILEIIQVPIKIASQTIDSILVLILVNLTSGVWIAFFLHQRFNSPLPSTIFMFLVVSCPSSLLYELYLTLKEIIGLPEKIKNSFQEKSQTISRLKRLQGYESSDIKDKNSFAKDPIKTAKLQACNFISIIRNIYRGVAIWKYFNNLIDIAHRLHNLKSILGELEEFKGLTARIMLLSHPLFLIAVTVSIISNLIWALITVATILLYIF